MDEKFLQPSVDEEKVGAMKQKRYRNLHKLKDIQKDLPFPWHAILLSVAIVFIVWSLLKIAVGTYFYSS